MKKILLQIVFFLSATIAMAQTDIQFSILKAEADGMSASVTNALDLKLRQVFDRLSGNLVGISINLCKSIQKELFINDTP